MARSASTLLAALTVLATAVGLVAVVAPASAQASARPVLTSLSTHRAVYWGGSVITVHGRNFTGVRQVTFGGIAGRHLQVLSPTTLTVHSPWSDYGNVNVRVVTAAGTSAKAAAGAFAFVRPTLDSPIMGGLTAHQEQRISAHVRATHHGAHTAARSSHWTAAMGLTAMKRARSWLGLPYSWDGGTGAGPGTGVCAHNGGDLDCHVVGFDCSGLSLYAWAPYESLAHYAQTQHGQAGRFHPTIGQLVPGDLVFFSGYLDGGIGHVAVYEGAGNVIEAAESGTVAKRSRLVDVIAYSGVYRGATRPMSTGRQGAAPHVSSVTASVSTKGGAISIAGTGLGAATSVAVGGTTVYSFARRSAGRLVITVPAQAAGKVAVTVSNAWGSASGAITYVTR